MCAKFQVCIVFVWPGDVTHINKYIHKYTSEFKNILDWLLASRGFLIMSVTKYALRKDVILDKALLYDTLDLKVS